MEKYSEKKIKEVVKRVVKEVVANQYRPVAFPRSRTVPN